jgi:hypothetical protein
MWATAYPVIAAVVTGLLALAGGFAGAFLTRRNEYEKWLRQERSTVFATFLRQLYEAQAKAIDVIYSTEGTDLMRDIQLSEIFQGLAAHAGVVRLYLQPDDRAAFSACIREFTAVHSPSIDQMLRLKKSESALEHVQATFERTIGLRGGKAAERN